MVEQLTSSTMVTWSQAASNLCFSPGLELKILDGTDPCILNLTFTAPRLTSLTKAAVALPLNIVIILLL